MDLGYILTSMAGCRNHSATESLNDSSARLLGGVNELSARRGGLFKGWCGVGTPVGLQAGEI